MDQDATTLFLARALDALPRKVLVVSPEYVILAANRHVTQHQDPTLIGRRCHEALHGRSAPCPRCPARDVIRHNRAHVGHEPGRPVDPAPRSCLCAFPFPDGDRLGAVALIDIDIAHLVEAETERHRQRPAARPGPQQRRCGGGRRPHRRQIYPEGEDERILDHLRGPEDGGPGKLERYRTTLRTREGNEVPVRLNAAMVYQDGQEVASIGFFRDLRSEIRMQRDLEQTQLQLLQAEKMSTLGELAAGVAHQLNNPLGSITLYAGLILEEYPLTEDLRQDLQRIALDADRCRDTVRELLAFARQTRRLMHPQNLNQAIERTLFLLQSHPLFQNIDIQRQLDQDLPEVPADGQQINHVLVNILVNAAQAMQGRGRLLVRTLALPHKDRVFVEIADSGPGIAPDTLPHIFEPFFTTKPEGQGTGLGLSLARDVVERHGGKISVDSRPGSGTRFLIELRRDPPPVEAPG